jgi:hypothetical protein
VRLEFRDSNFGVVGTEVLVRYDVDTARLRLGWFLVCFKRVLREWRAPAEM